MNQEMTIDGFLHGEDPLSTMNALNQIGAGISVDKNGLVHLCKRDYIFKNCEEPFASSAILGLAYVSSWV